MRYVRIVVLAFLMAVLGVSVLGAQSAGTSGGAGSGGGRSGGARSLKGMSLNGSTGLYSIPSGRTGWEQAADFGFDLGYHAIIDDGEACHIPKLSVSLFKWVELSAAFDIHPDRFNPSDKGADLIAGAKIQFPPQNSTAIAFGGNFQLLNVAERNNHYKAGQIYAAVTYAGQMFTMPAETTVVLGKTFGEHHKGSNIDFGMGFDILFLPNIFERTIHWITDFSNFSYSVAPFSANAASRGGLNTGLRIDLSIIPVFQGYKFIVDVLMTDAFDETRAFSVGVVFGVPIM